MQQYRNIVVLGAAYGGQSAAKVLAEGVSKLPGNWRVVAIDRNSHLNHVYAFPRFAVVGGHEHQAFIRYDGMVPPDKSSRLLNLTAQAQSLSPHVVTLDRALPEHGIPTPKLDFEYAIYALGSTLPAPVNLWGPQLDAKMRADPGTVETLQVGSKASGIAWLKAAQKVIREARSVLVVGGGALGIQFATDIADVYPEKRVTLLHSRAQLLPRFSQEMHNEILRQMNRLNVNVVLGERLDVQSVAEKKSSLSGERVVRTTAGRELAADLVLMCTGQKPNTEILRALEPTLLNEEGRVRVTRTLQLDSPVFAHMFAKPNTGVLSSLDPALLVDDGRARVKCTLQLNSPYHPHIFAVGDSADAFDAISSGRNADFQGCLAARNILRLIAQKEDPGRAPEPLEEYTPSPPGIKVSLGLRRAVIQSQGKVTAVDVGDNDDRRCAGMWRLFGHGRDVSDEYMRA
ncbi:FAD/NAD(P)-binding domain-containing protein [Schizophyllum commune Loenen D]|nr:FAD/NAD(P)-binding domain-containing protein [Schizophyllum commune Loenen D]